MNLTANPVQAVMPLTPAKAVCLPRNGTLLSVAKNLGRFGRAVAGWIPLTWLGLFAVLLMSVPLLLKIFHMPIKDKIISALCLAGLGLALLTIIQIVVVGLWVRFRRLGAPQDKMTEEAGVPFKTGFRLGMLRWNPLAKVEVSWLEPAGARVELVADGGGLAEQVTASERVACTEIVRCIRVVDVLGLSRVVFRRRFPLELEVKPAAGKVRPVELLTQRIAGDEIAIPDGHPQGDLVEMRRYAPGDPLKLVLWKVYARTGRMLVRMPERAVARSQKSLAYLVASEGDEASAGIARTVLESGVLGQDFLFGTDGEELPARTCRDGLDQLVRSVNCRPQGGQRLGGFLETASREGLHACLVFVPNRPGPWLERVASQLAGQQGPFRALIGVDGIDRSRKPGWLRKLFVKYVPGSGCPAGDVRQVVERLAGVVSEVCVVDRSTGDLVPTEWFSK